MYVAMDVVLQLVIRVGDRDTCYISVQNCLCINPPKYVFNRIAQLQQPPQPPRPRLAADAAAAAVRRRGTADTGRV